MTQNALAQAAYAYVRGYLPAPLAEAVIAMSGVRAWRENRDRPGAGDLDWHISFAHWTFERHADQAEAELGRHLGAIGRTVRPMIRGDRPLNAILAEAHNANAERGFPLVEREVRDAVKAAIEADLAWPARQRHGR